MGTLGLFCGVWNLWTGFGISSVACLETWSKRSRSMAFFWQREIFKEILLYLHCLLSHRVRDERSYFISPNWTESPAYLPSTSLRKLYYRGNNDPVLNKRAYPLCKCTHGPSLLGQSYFVLFCIVCTTQMHTAGLNRPVPTVVNTIGFLSTKCHRRESQRDI